MNHVWIIEVYIDKRRGWSPCAEASLHKKDAKREKHYTWEYNHPDEKFRIRKYVAQ